MKASELMTPDPKTLDARATIGDALELVSEHEIRHVPILRDGELVGMLSDRDLRRIEGMISVDIENSARVEAQLAAPVESIVQGAPVTVSMGSSLATVIDKMLEEHVGAVIVVGGKGEVRGIVSYVDVLRAARQMCPLVEKTAGTAGSVRPPPRKR